MHRFTYWRNFVIVELMRYSNFAAKHIFQSDCHPIAFQTIDVLSMHAILIFSFLLKQNVVRKLCSNNNNTNFQWSCTYVMMGKHERIFNLIVPAECAFDFQHLINYQIEPGETMLPFQFQFETLLMKCLFKWNCCVWKMFDVQRFQLLRKVTNVRCGKYATQLLLASAQ